VPAIFVAVLIPAACVAPALGQADVQRTDTHVFIDGPSPHRVIVERLAATVDAAADRLVVGRPIDQLRAIQGRLEETIGAVIDRIVPGYTVGGVALQLAAVTVVTVRFRPVGSVIAAVAVNPAAPTVHERVLPLVIGPVRADAPEAFRALYAGLPTAALSWAAAVLEPLAREAVERRLSGFTAAIRLRTEGATLIADVILAPSDSRVIRGIAVAFRSASVPLIVLDDYEAQVAVMADPLRGLPVEFARQRVRELAAIIDRALAVFPPAVQYHIVASSVLEVGEATRVVVFADSVLYRARVEAQLSIGTSAPDPRISMHLGRMVTPALEGFAELHIVPTTLALRWAVGAGYALSPSTTVGVTYAPTNRSVTAWAATQLSGDVGLRAAWDFSRRSGEGALIYRFNEFLSGELVGTTKGHFWLRLVSNL
jgi:hypothetical protein